ncbi:hypothetical protein BDN72DRAFT_963431 [Pluteus cervinus]|uniref:Uncharacterized protein n=1 Tax=Pluteus cervinus TaxID=181527 RepID=A0ACD3ADY7_9AGAR|nr:hypothetical protein BDN72DRAFT_963431 [Pluteus cervinus]
MATVPTSYLDKIADSQPGGYYLSKKFGSSDSGDVVFQSSDKVRFCVYKKDLATFSGGFPPAEFTSDSKEIVDLPEGGVVLDHLFSFTRPGRYPILHTLNIGTLVELADAAEKYEVYSAIMACSHLMRMNLTKHPLQVCRYAGKYQYPDLIDDVSPLMLDVPILQIFDFNMSEKYFRAWLRYLAQFQALHEKLFPVFKALSACIRCSSNLDPRLGTSMPSRTVLIEIRQLRCPGCAAREPLGIWTPIDGVNTWSPLSGVDQIYGDFQKFSAFL